MTDMSQQPNHTSEHEVIEESGNAIQSVPRSPSPKPPQDTTSDNEASEGPVREKLQKTTIASVPKDSNMQLTNIAEESDQSHQRRPMVSDPLALGNSSASDTQDRGRLLRKRSFEDTGADTPQGNTDVTITRTLEGRERKRSKDIHTGRIPRTDLFEQGPIKSPVAEEVEIQENSDTIHQLGTRAISDNDKEVGSEQSAPGEDTTDQEMKDHTFSPRKKRSRDPLDTDPHREQKIVATEEARAHRRSEEYERDENLQSVDNDKQSNGAAIEGHEAGLADRLPTQVNVQSNDFSTNSAASPFNAFAGPKVSRGTTSPSGEASTNEKTHTSSAAFASSGFAALSKSSASPFGSLPASSISNTPAFGSAASTNASKDIGSARGFAVSSSNSLEGTTTTTSSSSFGIMAPSPFGSVGLTSHGPSFSGGTFGSNLGGNSFGTMKLASFAAPGADTTWGGSGNIKPIGTSATKKSDDEVSDTDGEREASVETELEEDKQDERFQQQDLDTGEEGEQSIFTANRANLYAFEGSWKERGRGVFKLNVTTSHSAESGTPLKKARFIMRAHQTYRILLNTPVFKQMQVGDSRGNEPPGKQVSLAVIEGGKPTPYLIKLSDNSEAMTLYTEIRKLQEDM